MIDSLCSRENIFYKVDMNNSVVIASGREEEGIRR